MSTIDGQQEAEIRREPLIDCVRSGMAIPEIAQALGEPISKDLYRRVKELLKTIVEENRGEGPCEEE